MYYSMKIDESRPFCLWGKHLSKQRFRGIFRKFWNQNWKFTILSFNWQVKMFNPIRAGAHFFQMAISPWKKGSGGPKFCDSSYFIMKFQKIQKKICFFTVFWGDLEGAGPPCSQAISRSPALLGFTHSSP